MNHSHFTEVCKLCEVVISNCRCRGPKETKYSICNKCSINKKAYYQGTSDPDKDKGKKDTATPKERQDRDTRKHVLFRNFDYTSDGPNETSPGGGLYHGPMDKYKSVKDFIDKRRKENSRLDRNSQTRTAAFKRILRAND